MVARGDGTGREIFVGWAGLALLGRPLFLASSSTLLFDDLIEGPCSWRRRVSGVDEAEPVRKICRKDIQKAACVNCTFVVNNNSS